MKNLLSRFWVKVKLAVIVILSLTIGAVGMYDYLAFQEVKAESEKVWQEHLQRQSKNGIGEKVEEESKAISYVPADGSELHYADSRGEATQEVASPTPSVEEIIYNYFKDDYEIAKAVFTAESGLQKDAQGWNCYYGKESKACREEDREKAWSVDCGVAQINVKGKVCPAELFDPNHNLKVARQKYEARKWQPWCAFTSGKYKKYLATI